MSYMEELDLFDLQQFAGWVGDQQLKFDGINKWKSTQDNLPHVTKNAKPENLELWYTTEQLVTKWLKERKTNSIK